MTGQAAVLETTTERNVDDFDRVQSAMPSRPPSIANSTHNKIPLFVADGNFKPNQLGMSSSTVAANAIPPGSTLGASANPDRVVLPDAIGNVRVELQRARLRRDPEPTLEIVQRWFGVVEQTNEDSFIARLASDGRADDEVDEEGTFSLALVSVDDRELVKVGAHFTYTIGRETRLGTRSSVSKLTFRRMPMWHLRQIADAKLEAKRISDFLTEQAQRDAGPEYTTQRG